MLASECFKFGKNMASIKVTMQYFGKSGKYDSFTKYTDRQCKNGL